MLNTPQVIDSSTLTQIVQRTIKAIEAEESLPQSPGIAKGGRLFLCAAAALVYQTALTVDASNADHIAQTMVSTSKEQVVEEGRKLGLDPVFVANSLIINDQQSDEERRDKVLDYFRSVLA